MSIAALPGKALGYHWVCNLRGVIALFLEVLNFKSE